MYSVIFVYCNICLNVTMFSFVSHGYIVNCIVSGVNVIKNVHVEAMDDMN